MEFQGKERTDGVIELQAKYPPGCLAWLEAQVSLWLVRLAIGAAVFLAGVLVGSMWGQ